MLNLLPFLIALVATVLTVYGIETPHTRYALIIQSILVATVLTVYGIETLYPILYAI